MTQLVNGSECRAGPVGNRLAGQADLPSLADPEAQRRERVRYGLKWSAPLHRDGRLTGRHERRFALRVPVHGLDAPGTGGVFSSDEVDELIAVLDRVRTRALAAWRLQHRMSAPVARAPEVAGLTGAPPVAAKEQALRESGSPSLRVLLPS